MRDKRLATAVATLLAALATAHLMQFGLSAGQLVSGGRDAPPVGLATLLAQQTEARSAAPVLPAPGPRALPAEEHLARPADPPPARNCTRRLTARPEPGGLLRAEIAAPCDPGLRVEFAHAGLRFAVATDAEGRHVALIPALRPDATVEAHFPDGSVLVAEAALLDAAGFERVAMVAAGSAGLTLHAFEFGAEHGSGGHVHLGAAGRRAGAIVRLGDPALDAPLLGEVYTFPSGRFGALGRVRLEIEAVVTPRNCGQEVVADLVHSGGTPAPVRLSLAVPSCDATGEILILPLPQADVHLAGN
jgi:hypothetical protein